MPLNLAALIPGGRARAAVVEPADVAAEAAVAEIEGVAAGDPAAAAAAATAAVDAPAVASQPAPAPDAAAPAVVAAVPGVSDAPAPADPGAVAEACASAGVPSLARSLIDARLPMDEVGKRIETAGQIRSAVGLASCASDVIDPALADQLIGAGASLEHAKTVLFDRMCAGQSPAIHAGTPPVDGADPASLQAGWDHALEKVTGRSGAAGDPWAHARKAAGAG